MKTRLLALLLVVCVALSVSTGCSSPAGTVAPTSVAAPVATATNPASVTPQPSASASDQETVVFADDAGRKVNVPKNITRLAPSGPLAQMVLFPLAPEKHVGVSNPWSAEAKPHIPTQYLNLPTLGQFYGGSGSTLSLEELAKIDPQIIIDVGDAKSTIVEDMDKIQKQLRIPTVHIRATTKTMPDAYRKLGQLLGKEKEAEVLAQYLEKTYNNTLAVMEKVGDAGRVKLLYCLGDKGINVIAKGSYFAGVLDLTSNNVAVVDNPSSKGTGNEVDVEQIILWNPEVILFAPGSIYGTVANNPAWQQIDAIKNKKYYEVPIGPYNWMGFPPSVNQYLGMIWCTQLLYPDVAKYDAYQEIAAYYKLFYGSTLTQGQYKTLVANSLLKP